MILKFACKSKLDGPIAYVFMGVSQNTKRLRLIVVNCVFICKRTSFFNGPYCVGV